MVDVNQVADKKDFNLKEYSGVKERRSYQCNGVHFTLDSSQSLRIYFKFIAWLKDTSIDFDEIIRICNIFYNKVNDIDSIDLILYNSLVLEYNQLDSVTKCSKKRKRIVCIYIFIYIYIFFIHTNYYHFNYRMMLMMMVVVVVVLEVEMSFYLQVQH